eukprot:206797_1
MGNTLAKIETECEGNREEMLRRVLDNRKLRNMFEKHLDQEFSSENLVFVETVNIFMDKCKLPFSDDQGLLGQAKRIYKKFIDEESKHQVNLPHELKLKIDSDILLTEHNRETLLGLYRPAHDEIWRLMSYDSLRRFMAKYQAETRAQSKRHLKQPSTPKSTQSGSTRLASPRTPTTPSAEDQSGSQSPGWLSRASTKMGMGP